MQKKAYICALLLMLANNALAAQQQEEHVVDPRSGEFWGQIVAIFFLVILSGIVAGLTLGLMSLDTTNLAILEIAGTPKQKECASRIIPIRKNGHILLITLLLTNTVLNETLPILFDGIFSKGFISVIASTALLVLFSEILPQAIFSKHGLAIGALFAYPVRILIAVWFAISWPISKFLDYMLGTHTGFTYDVAEFAALIGLHDMSRFDHGTLKHDTANVLQNVLKMQDKQVCQIVTSASNMLMLNSDTVLSRSKLEQYTSHGYSHIFVYDRIILPTGCCSAAIVAGNHGEKAQHDDDDYQILGVLELKSLAEEETNFDEPIGRMKLQSYLTASSRESIIDMMQQLLANNVKEQVILIYRTESDVQQIKQQRAAEAREMASIQASTLKKHQSTLSCLVRRLFFNRKTGCHVCHNLLAGSSSKAIEESVSDRSSLSSNTTIDVAFQSGLLGMITLADILHQLLVENQPVMLKSSGKDDIANNKVGQPAPYHHLNSTKATICEPTVILSGMKAVNTINATD